MLVGLSLALAFLRPAPAPLSGITYVLIGPILLIVLAVVSSGGGYRLISTETVTSSFRILIGLILVGPRLRRPNRRLSDSSSYEAESIGYI